MEGFGVAEGVTFTSIEEEMKLAAKQIGLPSEGLQHRPPFVVVASNTYRQINGETKPVRVYPWGECVITDPLHSDFSLIKYASPPVNPHPSVQHVQACMCGAFAHSVYLRSSTFWAECQAAPP